MYKTLFLTLTLAFACATATADMRTLVASYEVAISDFRAPGNANGTLAMRPCDDCEFERLRVTGSTSYSINNEPVTLEDFRQALQQGRSLKKTIVIISRDIETDTVSAVSASLSK